MSRSAIRKVAYLVEAAVTPRNLDRFGMAWMADQGIGVTVWDVGPLTLPGMPGDRNGYSAIEGPRVTEVRTRAALKEVERGLAEADIVISLVGTAMLTPANIAVYRALARAGTPYAILSVNAYPGWARSVSEVEHGLGRRLRDLGGRLKRLDPVKSLVARIRPGWLGIPEAAFAIYGGRKSRVPNRFVGPNTVPVPVHSMDFETWRDVAADMPATTDTAVFIDEYRPYHPDLTEWGDSFSEAEAQAYFAAMRALFDRIENELGLEVVVAAMPKADYSDKPGVYGERRLETFRTAPLIAASRLVVAHQSTAIGLAVLAGKPVLQVALRDIHRRHWSGPYADAYAHALGRPLQFCDDANAVDLSNAFSFDSDKYGTFVTNYITENPTDAPFWRVALDRMNGTLAAA